MRRDPLYILLVVVVVIVLLHLLGYWPIATSWPIAAVLLLVFLVLLLR